MKTLFIGVDLQNDFMNHDGKLYVPGSEDIKPAIRSLSKRIVENHDRLYLTMDWHDPNDPELSDNPDFINTFPPHCIAGTYGAQIIEEAGNELEYPSQFFHKQQFSVFESNPQFLEYLNAIAVVDNIYVFGVAGDVCVKYVLDGLIEHKGTAFNFENIFIITDAIAALNPEAFEIFSNALTQEHDYIHIINSTEI